MRLMGIMMIKHTIILFASNGNNIGKTTTAKQLRGYLHNHFNNPKKELNEWKVINGYMTSVTHTIYNNSFADPIRKITKSLYYILFNDDRSYTFEGLYNQTYKNLPLSEVFGENKFKDYPELKEKSIRDLVNDTSDQLQNVINENLWAGYARRDIVFKSINQNHEANDCIFIYDDFRRPLEYNYLKKNLDSKVYNIITIYLDKEGNKSQVNTSHEGQLTDFPFDIKFTFKEDYSNIDELFSKIKNLLH